MIQIHNKFHSFLVASRTKSGEKVPHSKPPKTTPPPTTDDSPKKSKQETKPTPKKESPSPPPKDEPPPQKVEYTPRNRNHIDSTLNLVDKDEPITPNLQEKLATLKEINKKLIQPLAKAYKFHDMGHYPITGNSLISIGFGVILSALCKNGNCLCWVLKCVIQLGNPGVLKWRPAGQIWLAKPSSV